MLRTKLPFLGIHELPPAFKRVEPGNEWGPKGTALWRCGDHNEDIIMACLQFLASQLRQASIPARSALRNGNASIFQQPPLEKPTRRAQKNAVCLEFCNAKCEGLRRSGRYRQLVLGRDVSNQWVVIGAHRLICWAVHGPITDHTLVARHSSEGCEAKLACCSPLHLSFGTHMQNMEDVVTRKLRVHRQRCRNLHDKKRLEKEIDE